MLDDWVKDNYKKEKNYKGRCKIKVPKSIDTFVESVSFFLRNRQRLEALIIVYLMGYL